MQVIPVRKPIVKAELIAPCGMDCAVCMRRFRKKDQCRGCRGDDANKAKTVVACVIANCAYLRDTGSRFCSGRCPDFPCRRLKDLDKRYRAKYHMSMIENLEKIEASGIREFVRLEKARWACTACGGLICVHTGRCSQCGAEWSLACRKGLAPHDRI
jgi:hypothetical protein